MQCSVDASLQFSPPLLVSVATVGGQMFDTGGGPGDTNSRTRGGSGDTLHRPLQVTAGYSLQNSAEFVVQSCGAPARLCSIRSFTRQPLFGQLNKHEPGNGDE